jgi:thioredoxin-like negative regulator of GroEL
VVRAATQGKDFMAVRKILILWLLGWMWLSPVMPGLAQASASQAKPQILEFSRKLCPDCVKSQRVITAVQNQYPGRFVVRNFYLEEQEALFRRYKVAIVPSQVFLDPRGQKVYQHEGPFKPAELIKKLRKLKFIR